MVSDVVTFKKGPDCEVSQSGIGEIATDHEEGGFMPAQGQEIQDAPRTVRGAVVERQKHRLGIQIRAPDILFQPSKRVVERKGLAVFGLQISAGRAPDKGDFTGQGRPKTSSQRKPGTQVEELPPGYCTGCPALQGLAD